MWLMTLFINFVTMSLVLSASLSCSLRWNQKCHTCLDEQLRIVIVFRIDLHINFVQISCWLKVHEYLYTGLSEIQPIPSKRL